MMESINFIVNDDDDDENEVFPHEDKNSTIPGQNVMQDVPGNTTNKFQSLEKDEDSEKESSTESKEPSPII